MEREQFNQFVNEYQEFTRTTAQYPSNLAIAYTRLGFLGELGEVANKYKKVLRGDYELDAVKEDLIAESGDLLWYFIRYLDELDYRASWGFSENKQIKVYYNYTILDIVNDISSKFSAVPLVNNDYLLKDIGVLLHLLCVELDTTLPDVLTLNRRKLEDRLERNVIKGTGDNR